MELSVRVIISHLKERFPNAMQHLEYHLIEISDQLVKKKLLQLRETYPGNIFIHNCSFLEWKKVENRPVTVLFSEVFDNLPQDRIRFNEQGDLEQALVLTNDEARYHDEQGRYTEIFVPAQDPLIIDTVNVLDSVGYQWPSLSRIREAIYDVWPLTAFPFARPWSSEFVPTIITRFFRKLVGYFPQHQMIISDFDELPECIPGHGAPLVQTRFDEETVACSTYLLQRGLFDIFFPLNFPLLAKLYQNISGRESCLLKHRKFCEQYMNVKMTRTKSGYNPLLEDFRNVSLILNQPS